VVWPQNYGDDFLRFGLKTSGDDFLCFSLKTGGDGFSRFGLKTGGCGFFDLCLKTDSIGFVIWALKPPRRFLSLGIKTKQTTVCRLHHKSGGRMKMTWGMHQDLAVYFT
jgi:hypothetical protein